MAFRILPAQSGKIKIIIILIFIFPIIYYAYRIAENYFYLQQNYFNISITDTRSKNLSGKVILQNTADLKRDTLDLYGSNLVLIFSATWCKPCRDEIPLIAKLHGNQKKYHYKLYYILEEENNIINSFAKKNKIIFKTYTLTSGKSAQLNFIAFPTTIVCKNGRSDLKIVGQLSEADIDMIYKKFTDYTSFWVEKCNEEV